MFTHPKSRRLLKRQEFKRLLHNRRRYQGTHLTIEYTLRKDLTHPRLGITITRQYGKAHDRNLFKRRVKEIFRHSAQELALGIDMNVRAKLPANSFHDLDKEFQDFLSQLKNPQGMPA